MPERLVVWQRWAVSGRDGDDDARIATADARNVAARMQAAGALLAQTVGASSCATFDAADVRDALDAVLDLLDEADTRSARLAFGISLGNVDETTGAIPTGLPTDRALALSGRARAGEVTVDAAVRERASPEFLFGRASGGAAGALRGTPVDRAVPRRAACAAWLVRLGDPGVAPNHAPIVSKLVTLAQAPGARAIVLRAPAGAGVHAWETAILAGLREPLVLALGRVSGGLVPYGSIAAALHGLPDRGGDVLARVADGRAVPLLEARMAFRELAEAAGARRIVIVIDGLGAIDAASLELCAHVADVPAVLFLARLAVGATAPSFLAGGSAEEIVVPPLRTSDARGIAAAVLGAATDDDVLRRVAVLGGDLPLGVVEAARALVVAGDLAPDGEHAFAWRTGPRTGASALPVSRWMAERIALLDDATRRLLEVAAVAPEGATDDLLARVAAADGLDAASTVSTALARLRREALLPPPSLLPLPQVPILRRAVLDAMPPARTAELHRYVAAVLGGEDRHTKPFTAAGRAFHLAEGGRGGEAAHLWLDLARTCGTLGLGRAAARLALSAARAATSDAVRTEAATLATELRGQSRGGESLPPITLTGDVASPLRAAVQAMRARDFGSVEKLVDDALAHGSTPGAAEPLRAVAQLARGDVAAASRTLQRARLKDDGDPRAAARAALALALVHLRTGAPRDGVRDALAALALARAHADIRGEEAALHVMARCYEALGRAADAAHLLAD